MIVWSEVRAIKQRKCEREEEEAMVLRQRRNYGFVERKK